MVHLIVAVRAQREFINKWEEALGAVYLPYETEIINPKTGKRMMGSLQLGLRPVRLYDVTYPKAQQDLVLKLVRPTAAWTTKYQKYFNWLRRILGLAEVPKYQEMEFPHQRFVEVIGIGTKEDKTRNGVELL